MIQAGASPNTIIHANNPFSSPHTWETRGRRAAFFEYDGRHVNRRAEDNSIVSASQDISKFMMELVRQALRDRYPEQPLDAVQVVVPPHITNYVNNETFAKREAARVVIVRAAKDAKLARKTTVAKGQSPRPRPSKDQGPSKADV